MMRRRLLQFIMPQQGRGDTVTLAHPEEPYMQIHRKLRHEPNQSGEWIEDTAILNPLPHLHVVRVKLITRVDYANQTTCPKIRIRESRQNKLELPRRLIVEQNSRKRCGLRNPERHELRLVEQRII